MDSNEPLDGPMLKPIGLVAFAVEVVVVAVVMWATIHPTSLDSSEREKQREQRRR